MTAPKQHRRNGGTGPYADTCTVCYWPYPCPAVTPTPSWMQPAPPTTTPGTCCSDQPFTNRHTRTGDNP